MPADMAADTSYRQHRCRHGWVDVGQCEDCAMAKRVVELERFILALDAHKCGEHYHDVNEMQRKLAPTGFQRTDPQQ